MPTLWPPTLSLPQAVADLKAPYPAPQQFHDAASYRAFAPSLARLWLSEGIPYAFRDRPAVYESSRAWLGARLGVNAKCITLIGSGRIGFSVAPDHPWREYAPTSDLDFSVVSRDLLTDLGGDFEAWARDYESGALGDDQERRRYWSDNLEFGKRNLQRGFMDVSKIPYLPRYRVAQRCGQALFLLKKAIHDANCGLAPHAVSARIYRDWDVLIDRLAKVLPGLPAPSSASAS